MKQRLRIITLLLIGATVVMGIGLLALWASGSQAPARQNSPTPISRVAIDARQAYERAREAAVTWQSDVQLTGISASWSNASVESVLDGQVGWSFQFYSPATREVQYVSADANTATATRRRAVSAAPQTIDVDSWQVSAEEVPS